MARAGGGADKWEEGSVDSRSSQRTGVVQLEVVQQTSKTEQYHSEEGPALKVLAVVLPPAGTFLFCLVTG